MSEVFAVTKEIEFDAGHRVPNHKSKCRNPHGHRYKVKATFMGYLLTRGSDEGMVIDFGDIKDILTREVHDLYDHAFIAFTEDVELVDLFIGKGWKVVVVDFVPTAENLAKCIYDIVYQAINERGTPAQLQDIEVYETPTSVARYPA